MSKTNRRSSKEEFLPLLVSGNGKDGSWEDADSVAFSVKEEKIPYPKSVFFILSTETCERFSYYGMRTVLSLYLKHLLVKDGMASSKAEDVSTAIYHAWVFLSYFTSLFGALLADSFLGKFKTIFYISIVYAIGQGVLSLGSVPDTEQGIPGMPQIPISCFGLVLIAFGTGGIKPCVVAFGAEQFTVPQQQREITTFFGIFYACINLGSMISTLLTPWFRELYCLGEECYVLAFGVPAVLMVIAIVFFVCGKTGYKIVLPERNVVALFFQCIGTMMQSSDKAKVRFGAVLVSEVRAVLKVSVLFITFPMFWALYDQQGSRWTFQATRMNGQLGQFMLYPDQMTFINAALILLFIPIFDKGIYPLAAKCGLLKTPLQKIITGGVLLAISFLISAALETALEPTYDHAPGAVGDGDVYSARLAFHNNLGSGCSIKVDLDGMPDGVVIPSLNVTGTQSVAVHDDEGHDLLPFFISEATTLTLSASVVSRNIGGKPCENEGTISDEPVVIVPGTSKTLVFYDQDGKGSLGLYHSSNVDTVKKSDSGLPNFRLIYSAISGNTVGVVNSEFNERKSMNDGASVVWTGLTEDFGDVVGEIGKELGDLRVCLITEGGNNGPAHVDECAVVRGFTGTVDGRVHRGHEYFDYSYGACYNLYLQRLPNNTLVVDVEEVTVPNTVHMFWLLPQYIVLTAGEVLFSITSLAFAFTQAPENMKSVVQALYLLTTAIGNLIDFVVAAVLSGVNTKQSHEFLLFAFLMLLDMGVLAFMAIRYEYVDFTSGNNGRNGNNNAKLDAAITDDEDKIE